MGTNKILKTTEIKIGEVLEIDGGIFEVTKTEIDCGMGRIFDRYFLKVIQSPKQMKKFHKYIQKLEPISQKDGESR